MTNEKMLTLDEMLELVEKIKDWEFGIEPSGFPHGLFDEDDILYTGYIDGTEVSILEARGLFVNTYEISVYRDCLLVGEETSHFGKLRRRFNKINREYFNRESEQRGKEVSNVRESSFS